MVGVYPERTGPGLPALGQTLSSHRNQDGIVESINPSYRPLIPEWAEIKPKAVIMPVINN